jgi:hypothetical protein
MIALQKSYPALINESVAMAGETESITFREKILAA